MEDADARRLTDVEQPEEQDASISNEIAVTVNETTEEDAKVADGPPQTHHGSDGTNEETKQADPPLDAGKEG